MSIGKRDPETARKPAYISYCRKCGGMTGACADTPERAKDVADFARECIAGGLIIERKTAADVWAAQWCKCDDLLGQKADGGQIGLFGGPEAA